ncbi:MAG: undecaprenyl-phosphate glucose phosphotransferase, partial [Gallionella sp.]|nr:undecaprenyl-phosphate glucose phosphotransferase [Gallionella sp.]
AAALIEVINQSPWMGLRVQGVYDDEGASAQPEGSSADRSLEQLLRQVNARQIDSVYLTYSAQQEAKIRNLLEQLANSTVSVFIVPDVFVSDLFRAR